MPPFLFSRRTEPFQSITLFNRNTYTVKLGNKELFDKEQIGIKEPFPVTALPVYLINSEQIRISEQFFDEQKVPYCQV